MNRKMIFLLLGAMLLGTAAVASAQVNRTIGREQYKSPKRSNEKADVVEQSLNFYTKELKLDDFQKAASREIIEAERLSLTALREDRTITINERKDRAAAISDRIYAKMLPLLSKEQAEKFAQIQAERKF